MGKNIIALFKNEGLSTTIETNFFETDFIRCNLGSCNWKISLIQEITYHPLTIIRDIANMTKGCQIYLAMKKSMKKEKPLYEAALKKKGYKTKLT